MTDPVRRAFLADIRVHPADDAPRLIYADWLEEQGEDDRATFIRHGCAHREPVVADYWILAAFLPADHQRTDYAGPVRPGMKLTWVRGFLDRVEMLTADWLRQGPDLCRGHPTIREVVLPDRGLEVGGWSTLYGQTWYGRNAGAYRATYLASFGLPGPEVWPEEFFEPGETNCTFTDYDGSAMASMGAPDGRQKGLTDLSRRALKWAMGKAWAELVPPDAPPAVSPAHPLP